MTRLRDFVRVSASFRSHPKVVLLHRQLGDSGVLALLTLWAWVAQDGRHDGDLSGLTDEEIEAAACWTGEPRSFVEAVASKRLLDGEAGARRVHDWEEEQPWLASRPERCEQAREAGSKGGKASAEARRAVHGSAQPKRSRSDPEAVASKRSRSAEAHVTSRHDVKPPDPPEAPNRFEEPTAARSLRAPRAAALEAHGAPVPAAPRHAAGQPDTSTADERRAGEIATHVASVLGATSKLPSELTEDSRAKLEPYVPADFARLPGAKRADIQRLVYGVVRAHLLGKPVPALPENLSAARDSRPAEYTSDQGARVNGASHREAVA